MPAAAARAAMSGSWRSFSEQRPDPLGREPAAVELEAEPAAHDALGVVGLVVGERDDEHRLARAHRLRGRARAALVDDRGRAREQLGVRTRTRTRRRPPAGRWSAFRGSRPDQEDGAPTEPARDLGALVRRKPPATITADEPSVNTIGGGPASRNSASPGGIVAPSSPRS